MHITEQERTIVALKITLIMQALIKIGIALDKTTMLALRMLARIVSDDYPPEKLEEMLRQNNCGQIMNKELDFILADIQ